MSRVSPEGALDCTIGYMSVAHNPGLLLEIAETHLRDADYDTLVGTGLSGTIAVTELARKLGKKYLVVRKPNDGTHSHLPAEGHLGKRWVFVDDLVGTGRTISRCWDVVHKLAYDQGFTTEFVGAFLYSDRWFFGADSRMMHGWLHHSNSYDGRYSGPSN